jgi:hypothetical protein
MSFRLAWALSFVVLCLIAIVIGLGTKRGWLGVFIDSRPRYSLTHFQVLVWTLLLLSTMLGIFIASGFDPKSLEIHPTLLGLMGVVAGSATLATAVKSGKPPYRGTDDPKLSQMWLQEEGTAIDTAIDVSKFQGFLVTCVVVALYVTITWKTQAFPNFTETVVWLVAISHAGYVTAKIPNRGTVPPLRGPG